MPFEKVTELRRRDRKRTCPHWLTGQMNFPASSRFKIQGHSDPRHARAILPDRLCVPGKQKISPACGSRPRPPAAQSALKVFMPRRMSVTPPAIPHLRGPPETQSMTAPVRLLIHVQKAPQPPCQTPDGIVNTTPPALAPRSIVNTGAGGAGFIHGQAVRRILERENAQKHVGQNQAAHVYADRRHIVKL